MAPKKKNKEIDPEVKLSPEENNISLSQEVKILERELVVYREEAAKVSSVELELRARVEELEKDLAEEKEGTFAVTANMARQYKALQEELIARVNALETILTEQKEELDMTEHELKEMITEKDEKISDRKNQIKNLRNKMDSMEKEFVQMLNQTCAIMADSMKQGIFAQADHDLVGILPSGDESAELQLAVAGESGLNHKFEESDKRMRLGHR